MNTCLDDTILHDLGCFQPCKFSQTLLEKRFQGSLKLDDVDGASLLFSGGAKGALMAHILSSTETLRCIWSTSLGSVDPIKMENLCDV